MANQIKVCRAAALTIEIILDQADKLNAVVRNMNGQPIKVFNSTEAIIGCLNDVVNDILSSDKTAAE